MRSNYLKTLKTAVLAVTVLLLGTSVSLAQQTVNLTADPSTAILPDGSTVPMWGYSCGAVEAGSSASCSTLKPGAGAGVWSPILITVPSGQGLKINLQNNLSFPVGSLTPTTKIPTSLVIVGQFGGGLGTPGGSTASPDHTNAQTVTWPAADSSLGATAPAQGPRVRSFGTEVPVGPNAVALTWEASKLRPGTYLLESGTHPSIQGPMGLYGILVVTKAPAGGTAGEAYPAQGPTVPAVTYNADIPLLFSEIDPVQNKSVDAAVNTANFDETKVWSGQPNKCGNPASSDYNTCYPPAVNYTPLYYLINGVAFDKTNSPASLFSAAPGTAQSPVSGNVLVRLVNAGLRMHVPSIVGAQIGAGGAAAPAGFSLIAEDGNRLPGTPRIQSDVFMAAGKTYDVMINVPAAGGTALPIFDRQLSLSANATSRDAGMLAYISVNAAGLPAAPAFAAAVAVADTYNSLIPGETLTVSDPAKGLIANDSNIYGVKISGAAPAGLSLNANGTFAYTGSPTSFTYCGNSPTTAAACALVTLGAAPVELGAITLGNDTYTSRVATTLSVKSPGVLANDTDAEGYPLTVNTVIPGPGLTICPSGVTANCIAVNPDGSFNAYVSSASTYTFKYTVKSGRGTVSAAADAATVTLIFPQPSGLSVTLVDGKSKAKLPGSPQDYRWIIEEDRTFYIDPTKTSTVGNAVPLTFGTNFHTSYMPVVAQGCTGTLSCENGQMLGGVPAVCDIGNGACRTNGAQKTAVLPSEVVLDPSKRYYISVLPGDAVDPGHAMGGAQIPAACTPTPPATTCTGTFAAVNVIVEPMPLPPAKVSVFVFEDDHPLNGEHDAGGGIDTLSPNEPGLGSFNILLFDDVGGTGDAAGQMTYDMSNMPLSNSLAGMLDPVTGVDACPISQQASNDPSQAGITGVIPVCPTYEADGTSLSPLAGQAVVANLPPGRYGIVATPGADRIARGEQWLQTNTLDGGKAHDSFVKVSEPSYFQEFGPAGYHVAIGFAEPTFITRRKAAICADKSTDPNRTCTSILKGKVTGVHMSRTPDERLYSSGTRDTFGYTQCYVSLGSPDGAEFDFTKCADDGSFQFSGIPNGDWKITVFDQWNDQIVDGISTPVRQAAGATNDLGDLAVHAWKQNLYTRTFFDQNGDGVSQDNEPGLALVPTNIRFRDGSFSNFNSTDLGGFAGFNEIFPLFNWYVLETDSTRYKNTGTHVVNDAGGPVDGSPSCGAGLGFPTCGDSTIGANYARTLEDNPLPLDLRFPGSRYCAAADCPAGDNAGGSTGRIDPPTVTSYGWQGFAGQNQFLEFGKKPFDPGENGGIRGHVIYTSTRPFDDPAMLLQLSWEPGVPNVTINLYKEGTAPDGSQSLTLVDTTKTTSWDEWAQGFRSPGVPNMNCPGQGTSDPFYFSLKNQPSYLDVYNAKHGGPSAQTILHDSQFKCYDGMHNWAQLQPAPYDGMYQFPSVTSVDANGKPNGTNCTKCTPNPAPGTDWSSGLPMLPAGKYVVEVVVPPGYELVKEEDKNILLGDTYVAPVTQQFGGLSNIFIMPDQATVSSSYNPNNALNPTNDLGVQPRHEGDTGSVEAFWPCVGAERIVPDFNSLFPQAGQNAPFAGAKRRLCDRKEVTLNDQMSALAKFYVFTSTHVAGHYTGIITDDFTSEFDPFSPHFGEKFSPANLPVSVKDWAGNEVSRVYSDQWGIYDGLNFSSFGVNPPDPSGYVPAMMVMCMNDRGSAVAPDPLYQDSYSQFCYELPFMPGQTGYFDTPVIPTTAFAEGYNHPDCAYPDATPAISKVDGDGIGPWVSGTGRTLTIHSLGDQSVNNYGYSGPDAPAAPFNNKTVTRHYGFGSRCMSVGGACLAVSSVSIGVDSQGNPIPAAIQSWSDSLITVTVPNNVPMCSLQQRGVPNERCGQLVITAGNGKQSVDAVTVTIGTTANPRQPKRVLPGGSIQSAIDSATPGDLIIVPPGTYSELLVMWKPVRLQGVGAASVTINADPHPAGKLVPWRERIVCLFGLGTDGVPGSWNSSCGGAFGMTAANGFKPTRTNPQVDRLPLEATVGWDATLNGNLAEQLQEPTLMGAYEGAAITVLSKGVRFRSDPFAADTFPTNTTLLGNNGGDCNFTGNSNGFASNFNCNPSRIDGISISNSSQGGGGIFVHGWAHNLEIANNRIHNNQGTLSGGIQIGQGEHPDAYLVGSDIPAPGSCQSQNGLPTNTQLPYCFNRFVNVHNNAVTVNSSEGDELFSATPAGAGGVSFCTGADDYSFNNNWVCGNLSTGDGGGFAQLGYVWNAKIQHNAFLFNESTNPTVPTDGGGLVIMSTPDTDPTCPGEPDQDCPLSTGGVSDGTGPGMVIDANLILGNAADSGAGGGLRLQGINGAEVGFFPTAPSRWYSVKVTNNIIANNVAGWDGAGVSLQDSLAVNFINNTVISNDSTASSGVLFDAFFAPLAGAPGQTCNGSCNRAAPQPSGLSVAPHSAEMRAVINGNTVCPAGHASCKVVSDPLLSNDVFWQNRSFHIGVTPIAAGSGAQQSVVDLVNAFTNAAVLPQAKTGDCVANTQCWDIGVRGDTGVAGGNQLGAGNTDVRLSPRYSVIAGYPGQGNKADDPRVTKQYCNGSRIPPELGATGFYGYHVPPGTNESNVPVPVFSLTAGATVDEGNNWINITWGPLAMTDPTTNAVLGDYRLTSSSPAIDAADDSVVPVTDFFGRSRPQGSEPDMGAVEFVKAPASDMDVTPLSLAFGDVGNNTDSQLQFVTVSNTGSAPLTGLSGSGPITVTFDSPRFTRVTSGAGVSQSCSTSQPVAAGASCRIYVRFHPTAVGAVTGTMTINTNDGSPDAASDRVVQLSGRGVKLGASPSSLTFLTLSGGNFGATQTVTVTNFGPGAITAPITTSITNVTNGVIFEVQNATSTCPKTATGSLAQGATCLIRVRFRSPTALTQGTGTLNISDTEPATVTVGLIGTRLF